MMNPTMLKSTCAHLLDQLEDGACSRPPSVQCKAEEHGQQQDLQHIPSGEGVDESGGDDVENEVDVTPGRPAGTRVLRHRVGIQARGVSVYTSARLHDVDDHEPDHQRDGGHPLEIKERQPAGLADVPQLRHSRDAGHDGAEDDGRDQHADQLDEAIAQGPQLLREVRPAAAQQDAHRDGDEYLHVKRAPACDAGA